MIDKNFDFKEAEPRIYDAWEKDGCFKAGTKEGAENYCIVIPPPNVTGSLHMGHALNNTLQDVLCRFERMRGKNVLWQVGTDHAGIATQMVVERQLAERQEPGRRELGREKFLEKVWAWKEESGGTITRQLRRLGASCDWSRERFTMDEGLSAAVRKVFVQLYKDGLIYRDKRLVNWDPKFQTAISDLEVENEEVDGHFWHFKYPLENGETYEFPTAHDEDGNPTEWETRDYISIATTRPETMLGDGAVAVHPSDERYAPIVGKRVLLPLADRYIPIIADEHPDPDFGSGAVKITGAHDFNDYQVAKRHNIPMYILMDGQARMADADHVPEKYRGLDRYDARKQVVADIDALGLLERVEDKKVMQPFGDRSGVVIEPMLTDQWFVNAEELAKPAIAAVENGDTKFVPPNWDKTYYQWMRNIEPWCISRQLWWGHQIPVWYGPKIDKSCAYGLDYKSSERVPFCGNSFEEIVEQAKEYYGRGVVAEFNEEIFGDRITLPSDQVSGEAKSNSLIEDFHMDLVEDYRSGLGDVVALERDTDVLDTWFSSALWPFSTLGWPEETPELQNYYPTAVLSTAFDIIFFWVARMMMMGLHFKQEIPFHTVYIHALVRDEEGKKMSKSVGNVIDPVDLIDGIGIDELVAKRIKDLQQQKKAQQIEAKTRKQYPNGFDAYGTDALRFTLTAMAAQGRDLKLSVDRVAGYRNFGTKLWNAAKFTQMNECAYGDEFDPASVTSALNQWIVHEASLCAEQLTEAIEAYRFNDAAAVIYRFTWNIFCDWFLEFAKPVFNGDDAAAKAETQATAAWALDQILIMLHPMMPFITEELWSAVKTRDHYVMQASWPTGGIAFDNAAADINWLIDLITEIRSVRAEMNVPAGAKVPVVLVDGDARTRGLVETHRDLLMRLARIETLENVSDVPKGAVQIVHQGATFAMPLADIIDIDAELARLTKAAEKLTGEITGIEKKLSNENFVSKAPKEVVEAQHAQKAEATEKLGKLSEALERLKAL
jgi:valyl-tRNA synthetase